MNKEAVCYFIKMTDGGYASFYQEYDGDDVRASSVEDVTVADHWNENVVHEIFEELIKGESEYDFYYLFDVGIRPLKIVRAIIAVDSE